MTKRISALWGIAFTALLVPASAVAQVDPTGPLVQIRVAQEEASAGAQRAEVSGRVLFLANEAIVDDSHIEFIRVTRTATGLQLRLQLTEDGASRLRLMTAGQSGKRLGVLVGSQLVSAPMIREELTVPEGRLDIGVPLAEDKVEPTEAALRARFKELPPSVLTQF